MLRRLLAAAAIAAALAGVAAAACAEAKFTAFIETLWPRAKAAGISRALFDRAFAGITEPDPAVLKLARNQPEFTSTTSQYLAKAVTPIRIDTGRQMRPGEPARGDRKEIRRRWHILLGIWE
jgi:membrane-bound lytic murein transglycosylase B